MYDNLEYSIMINDMILFFSGIKYHIYDQDWDQDFYIWKFEYPFWKDNFQYSNIVSIRFDNF